MVAARRNCIALREFSSCLCFSSLAIVVQQVQTKEKLGVSEWGVWGRVWGGAVVLLKMGSGGIAHEFVLNLTLKYVNFEVNFWVSLTI